MADRYLLESGAPDGYLLEDGTGVYLLETPPASPVTQSGQIAQAGLIARPSIQGGYSTVPNLLVTTLAVVAATSVMRGPLFQQAKQAPAVQAFQVPNLLTSTIGVQVVPIPPGKQQTSSAPSFSIGNEIDAPRNGVLLDTVTVVPIPPGKQRTESAPPTPSVLYWDKGSNTLLFTTPPAGEQRTENAPSVAQSQVSPSGSNLPLLAPAVQAIPQGKQGTDSAPYAVPRLNVDQPPNVLAQFPPAAAQPLPPGKQETDSAPPAQRIGSIVFARGVDPGPPVPPVTEPPFGRQQTDGAPIWSEFIGIDQPANLLGSAIGLQPIASAQSEWMPTLSPAPVYLWLAPNVTINLPSVAIPIPPGKQETDSAPAWNAPVQSYTAPNTLPFLPVLTSIPQGEQRTESAPYAPPRLNVDQPVNLLCIVQPLPVGRQHTDSAPAWNAPVQSYEAPNATLFIPPPGALPPGQQWSASAPIVNPPVWSQNSTIPPDLLPPPAPAPTVVIDTHDGGRKKKHKRDLVEEKRLAQERLRAQLTALVDPKPLTEVIEQVAQALPVFKETEKPVILPALPVEDDDEEDILKLLMSYYEIPRRILP